MKRVAVDLSGFNIRLLLSVQLKIPIRYGWRCCSAFLNFESEAAGFMSSAYEVSDTPAGGGGK